MILDVQLLANTCSNVTYYCSTKFKRPECIRPLCSVCAKIVQKSHAAVTPTAALCELHTQTADCDYLARNYPWSHSIFACFRRLENFSVAQSHSLHCVESFPQVPMVPITFKAPWFPYPVMEFIVSVWWRESDHILIGLLLSVPTEPCVRKHKNQRPSGR